MCDVMKFKSMFCSIQTWHWLCRFTSITYLSRTCGMFNFAFNLRSDNYLDLSKYFIPSNSNNVTPVSIIQYWNSLHTSLTEHSSVPECFFISLCCRDYFTVLCLYICFVTFDLLDKFVLGLLINCLHCLIISFYFYLTLMAFCNHVRIHFYKDVS